MKCIRQQDDDFVVSKFWKEIKKMEQYIDGAEYLACLMGKEEVTTYSQLLKLRFEFNSKFRNMFERSIPFCIELRPIFLKHLSDFLQKASNVFPEFLDYESYDETLEIQIMLIIAQY